MIKTKSKLPYIAGLLIALVISVGAGYFFVGQGEDYSAVDTSRRVTAQPSQAPQPSPTTPESSTPSTPPATENESSTPPEKFSPPPKQTGALNWQDLSLGVITIDDPQEKVQQALGSPMYYFADNDLKRLRYNDLEVVIRNGKVSALVSQTSAVSTPRGIHDGSPAQQVFDEYGTNYQQSSFENTTLYEYPVTSKDGTPCLLRFAVRDADNRVDYISIRFVQ